MMRQPTTARMHDDWSCEFRVLASGVMAFAQLAYEHTLNRDPCSSVAQDAHGPSSAGAQALPYEHKRNKDVVVLHDLMTRC